jgi:hypothetical protein
LTAYIAVKVKSTLVDRLLHRRRKRFVNPRRARIHHMDGDGPRFGAMIGLVAVVVAAVILVFFGIGYALGRLFL